MSRALIAVLAATTLVLSLDGSAGGFGTVNRFGQHAEHERITRAALSCAAAGAPGKCFQPTLDSQPGRRARDLRRRRCAGLGRDLHCGGALR